MLDSLTPAQQIVKIVNEELIAADGRQPTPSSPLPPSGPTVVMMVGLQGAGKTTNGAKLAGLMRRQFGKRPLLVACDVYRPAAIDPAAGGGRAAGHPRFRDGPGRSRCRSPRRPSSHARDHGNDMVFLDTAGRLHVDEALMDELKNIKATVHPNEILLVVDAMTGQDAVNAATAFDQALGIDGVMLTKLDGDARGGAALSIRAATGKPIKFVGTGEKLDMIELFHPDRMASRILGMGDMLTFIEKAEQQLRREAGPEAGGKAQEKPPDPDGLLWSRWTSCKRWATWASWPGCCPVTWANSWTPPTWTKSSWAAPEAIIQSMTPLERENPSILNASRKKRIAAGCGLQVVGCEPAAEVTSRCSSSSPSPFPRAASAASEVPAACLPWARPKRASSRASVGKNV